jgi:hypothetical protein
MRAVSTHLADDHHLQPPDLSSQKRSKSPAQSPIEARPFDSQSNSQPTTKERASCNHKIYLEKK